MAGDAEGGSDATAANAGAVSQLPGQLVGSGTECLESRCKSRSVSHDHAYLLSDREEEEDVILGEEQVIEEEVTITTTKDQTNQSSSGSPPVIVETKGEEQSTPILIDNSSVKISSDMVFGTYDEAANCITIFMPPAEAEDKDKEQQEQRISVSTSQELSPEQIKSMAAPLEPCLSPLSSLSLMESGYQSMGSPDSTDDLWSVGGGQNEGALDDLWNDSFSELFPSLV